MFWKASDTSLLLVVRVGEEADFDDDRRHVGAGEHSERGLQDRAWDSS